MYIRQFRIRNYLIHQDTSVALSPLTIFVGPQGGGKSAFFDAMLNFSIVSRGNLRQAFAAYPYSYRATIHRAASKVSRIGYRATLARSSEASESLDYEIEYAQTATAEDEPTFNIFHETLTRQPGGAVLFDRRDPEAYPITRTVELQSDRSLFAALRHARLAGTTAVDADDLVLYCTEQISRFNKFRLDAVVLAQTSRMPDPSGMTLPRIGYHGEDLAATLYHLNETKDPALDSITKNVSIIDPQFAGFDFNAVGTERIAFSARYSDARQLVPSVRLSSGMLTYVGLITLVSTSSRPPVLMIEEPENGLTPQAIKCFYAAVRSLATNENPEHRSQVLISSHSPYVICEAWNGEDRDFIHQVKVVNGKAQIRKFSQVVEDEKIHLRKDKVGERTVLGLVNAEEIMAGYLS
jgi:predicted ATPase